MSGIKNNVVAIILAAVTVFFTGCGKSEGAKPPQGPETQSSEERVTPEKPSDSVQHKVLSFNLEGFTEKGAKNWEVTGRSAESVSETELKLNDIVAKSYGTDSKATITADEGIYDKTKNNVTLEKNVKATIENAQMLAAGPPAADAAGPAPQGEDAGKKKRETVITCDGDVQFDYEKNLVVFNKNVKVVNPDVTIDADMITVNLEPETKKVRDIVAEGNVRIARGDNITYSEKATYIEADKKVILSGKPKIVMYQEGAFDADLIKK
jgi:lipopolysaccharide export system protein LptA